MKKLSLYLGIIICLTNLSCAYEDELYIDPELMPYWNQFNLEAERLGINLNLHSLVLTIEEPEYRIPANGLSHTNKRGAIIEISPRLFKDDFQTYSKRVEATVFHELGHGILRRHHNNEYYDSTYLYVNKAKNISQIQSKIWSKSLMTVPQTYKYYMNGEKREYYLRELFGLSIKKQNGVLKTY